MSTSAVWLYAKRRKNDKGQDVAVCNECGNEYVYAGTTSTVRTHLRTAHKIELPKLTPKRKTIQRRQQRPGSSNSNLEDEDSESVDDPSSQTGTSGEGSNLSAGDAAESTTRARSLPPPDTTPRPRNDRGTLLEQWREMASLAEGGRRHTEITDAMLFMIAHDNMPLRTPERTGFRVFCKKMNAKYKVPCEPTTTQKMHLKYKSLRARVKDQLGKTNGITLTMDIWTNKHKMTSFLGMTAHYLEGVYLKSVEMTARPLKGHKSAENLQPIIRSILEEWNIDTNRVSAVITDGGGNIKNAVKEIFGVLKHIACFGHLLNLIGTKAIGLNSKATRPSEMEVDDPAPELPEHESDIEDYEDDVEVIVEAVGRQAAPGAGANHVAGEGLSDLIKRVKKIVTFFRQSEVATSQLNDCQKDAGKRDHECLKLIQECRTRWNSAYEMLNRFLMLSDEVTLTLMKLQREKRTKSKPPNMLTNDEIGILREARDLLRPLAQATVEASADKHVTISKIIPLVNLMREKIESHLSDSGIAFNLQQQLLQDIRTNFGHLEHAKPFAAATILDPRFKKLPFKNARAVESAISYVGDLMKTKIEAANLEEASMDEEPVVALPATQEEEDDLWTSLDRNVQANRAARRNQPLPRGAPDELQRYLQLPNISRKNCQNPIEYLEGLKDKFPLVYDVARDVLPIIATSTPCERLFSHAGLIFSQLRCRLSGSMVDELVFLRSVDEETWFSVKSSPDAP